MTTLLINPKVGSRRLLVVAVLTPCVHGVKLFVLNLLGYFIEFTRAEDSSCFLMRQILKVKDSHLRLIRLLGKMPVLHSLMLLYIYVFL